MYLRWEDSVTLDRAEIYKCKLRNLLAEQIIEITKGDGFQWTGEATKRMWKQQKYTF